MQAAVAAEALGLACGDEALASLSTADIEKAAFRARRRLPAEVVESHAAALREHCASSSTVDMSQATEIADWLLVAPHGIARDKVALEGLGVTAIVSIAAECGPQFPEAFACHWEPLVEHQCTIDDLAAAVPRCVNFIESALAARPSSRCLVHCMQGKTRSAAVAACAVAVRSGVPFAAAYGELHERRDVCVPDEWLGRLEAVVESMRRVDEAGGDR